MIARRAIGFEAMRQRIHAGRSRQLRRQSDGKLRIKDGNASA